MNNYCVYIHRNKINGKVYIGQTSLSLKRRWNNGLGYKRQSYFYSAIQKYGWNNFEHIILKDNLTLDEANYWESYYIKYYDSMNQEKGYNLTSGGDNYILSEESKEKIRQSKIGEKNPRYGHIYTEEEKKKLSQGHIEYYKNEEAREKTSEAMKKYYQTPGAKEKQRQIIRKFNSKAVQCLETNQIFECVIDAARWCGLFNGTSISRCCKGINKSAGKHPVTKQPLHWKYMEDDSDE